MDSTGLSDPRYWMRESSVGWERRAEGGRMDVFVKWECRIVIIQNGIKNKDIC